MNETLTKFRQVVADTAELQKEVKAGADWAAHGRGNRYEFMQDELSVDEVEWQEGHGWLVFFLSNLN